MCRYWQGKTITLPMKAVFELIGPEKAQEYLAKNISNRTIRAVSVAKMVDDMVNERWHNNGSPLRFDESGNFVDGQHRLRAVIKSGTTQTFLVVYDVPKAAHRTIDGGIVPRSPGDILHFSGVKNPKNMAAIAKKILAWNKNKISIGVGTIYTVSTSEVVEFVLDNDLSEYVEFAQTMYGKARFFHLSDVGFLFWLFSQINHEDAIAFLTLLHTGTDLREDSPIYVLRKRLEKDLFSKSNLPASEKQALVIKAWNFYRQRKSIKVLKYSIDEEKPMPI